MKRSGENYLKDSQPQLAATTGVAAHYTTVLPEWNGSHTKVASVDGWNLDSIKA